MITDLISKNVRVMAVISRSVDTNGKETKQWGEVGRGVLRMIVPVNGMGLILWLQNTINVSPVHVHQLECTLELLT